MKQVQILFSGVLLLLLLFACEKDDTIPSPVVPDNPEIALDIPPGFPVLNASLLENPPTQYGVLLGERLFQEKKLSGNNTISCATCHQQGSAFADHHPQSVGIYGRVGLRNTPALQNLAFMKRYNWDGNKLDLKSQALVPIITHEEMNASIVEVIKKLNLEHEYKTLFEQAFGDPTITPDRIYQSLAQYQYTLISANSKYDRVRRKEEEFTLPEARGYQLFQQKCGSCHSTELFTDQSFRNVGFPLNSSTEEAGRARVTGLSSDWMRFRVPSLRNAAFTAPYGSFGQFPTLKSVLDYFDQGVLKADNLDPILKANGNRIPMTEQEKLDIIDFIHTLSDAAFLGR